MKVEKIHDNKISVFISIYDLEDRKIDIENFSPENSSVQELFLDILEEAYLQKEFDIDGYQLFVEAKLLSDNGYHICITKFYEEEDLDVDVNSGYYINKVDDFFSIEKDKKTVDELVYSFHSIESIESILLFLNRFEYTETYLFYLNKLYYFSMKFSNPQSIILSNISAYLSEYANKEYCSIAFLREHGKSILEKNALEDLEKYFKAEY